MKIVIVGGVAGGASAAARARRLSEDAHIVLIERGAEPSFANCGMPYYVGGVIDKRDALLVAPVERLRQRLKLDVRVRQSVESIDRGRKRITVRELETGHEYEESYEKLILAPGAAPVRPPLPGIDSPGIYSLRNLADADRLLVAAAGAKDAVVLGGGFIGLEMVENLLHRRVKTTVVERNAQVLTPWDAEMVVPVVQRLRERGVELLLGREAESFHSLEGGRVAVSLKGQGAIDADLVVLSVGVRPENHLAAAAGLAVGPRGGIVVRASMQTSDPDIYAVGDAVQVTHAVTKESTQIPLAGPANRQGRIAADAIFGRGSHFRGVQGTAIVGVLGITAAMTGLSEKACVAAGFDYQKVYVHPANHAGYYPGAEGMSLKLLFSPIDGRVLGAQAVGGAGVDKRIDVIAMAIQGKMTVYDLEEAELCYAPQYGSAKDPVNMAGFVAAGVLRGDHPVVHADEVDGAGVDGATILDVRTPAEFAAGSIPGAVNIPVDSLRARIDEVPRDRPVIAYCQVGMRGYLATRVLAQNGYNVRNLSGGYLTYASVREAIELAD
jgi:NADPH-dependent 2,4-dienoyl-CoA reductase/sulfur reductase-like enzyme/rhodanese-related sulfurtransferase